MSSTTGEQDRATAPVPRGDRAIRPREPGQWSAWERRCDRVRWALVLGWLVLAVLTVLVGERESRWGDVKDAVATDRVHSVELLGEMSPVETGYSTVQVRWQTGLVHHVAEVRQVRDRPPSQVLRDLQPDVRITRTGEWGGSFATVAGWRVPGATAAWAVLLMAAWFGLLVAGPQPWRATRWAWFWLALPPFGMVAFLLLSGPTPGLPRPHDPARRLTGGWAFLLALVLGGGLRGE